MTETTTTSAGARTSPPTCSGALEPGEAAELERHVEGCERCREEIRWLTPAVNALPESVERLRAAAASCASG